MGVRFAICINDQETRQRLLMLLERKLFVLCADAVLDIFASADQFRASFARGVYDFVFLDTTFDHLTGLELAKHIRNEDTVCQLVFISDSSEQALSCYFVHPAGYLLKPVDYALLCDTLDWNRKALLHGLRYIELVSSRIPIKVFLTDIISIEVQGRVCMFQRINGATVNVNQSLTDLMQRLEKEPFFRCHRRFAINWNHVAALESDGFRMSNGQMVPVSADKIEEAEQAFANFQTGALFNRSVQSGYFFRPDLRFHDNK